MGKITFRADDDLVDELEAFDASKSEVMREALRSYLDREAGATARPDPDDGSTTPSDEGTIDALVCERVDDIVRERVDEVLEGRLADRRDPRDVSVNISLDGEGAVGRVAETAPEREERAPARRTDRQTLDASDAEPRPESACGQCGETLDSDHVYCPNCGEKAAHRLFCECGDEVRSDWSFCPGCGRRTPAADVLESS